MQFLWAADTIWLNTVLYNNHPIESFSGINIIGQRPSDVSKYDDKYYTNNYLRNLGFPVVKGVLLNKESKYNGDFSLCDKTRSRQRKPGSYEMLFS